MDNTKTLKNTKSVICHDREEDEINDESGRNLTRETVIKATYNSKKINKTICF